ncbi:hypothetical protein D3C76_1429540 [compost metagenome]
MLETELTSVGGHDVVHCFGTYLAFDIFKYKLAADINISAIGIRPCIFPRFQI